jgi:hypothetical protein
MISIHAFGSDGRTENTEIPELKKYAIIREYGVREYEETFQFTPLMEDIAGEHTIEIHFSSFRTYRWNTDYFSY